MLKTVGVPVPVATGGKVVVVGAGAAVVEVVLGALGVTVSTTTTRRVGAAVAVVGATVDGAGATVDVVGATTEVPWTATVGSGVAPSVADESEPPDCNAKNTPPPTRTAATTEPATIAILRMKRCSTKSPASDSPQSLTSGAALSL
jgi:hypothetical protein